MALLMANPIYDCVFNYLLADAEIARELLATILGEEIVSLEAQPREKSDEWLIHAFGVYRLDFEAMLKTGAGEQRQARIEVRKTKHRTDIMRLLRHLADKHRKEATVTPDGGAVKRIPVVTIYFLGFTLTPGYPAVFKTNQQVTNALTGEALVSPPREPLVELLRHGSYTIQLPLLREPAETRLAQALLIFNQEHRTEDPRELRRVRQETDPLAQKMADRLTLAIAEEQMGAHMHVEDEMDRTIGKLVREKDAIIEAIGRREQ